MSEMEELSDREIADKLWCILDDIDSASDMFKPSDKNPGSYERFYNYVMKKHRKRFDYLASDGYDLYTKSEWREKNINTIVDDEPIQFKEI